MKKNQVFIILCFSLFFIIEGCIQHMGLQPYHPSDGVTDASRKRPVYRIDDPCVRYSVIGLTSAMRPLDEKFSQLIKYRGHIRYFDMNHWVGRNKITMRNGDQELLLVGFSSLSTLDKTTWGCKYDYSWYDNVVVLVIVRDSTGIELAN